MNKNLSALAAFVVTAICTAILAGSIIGYRANTMLLECAANASAPMSNEAMMQVNVQQMGNLFAGFMATFGGVGGLITFLVNWWKSGEPTLIVNELKEKYSTGDKSGMLSFSLLVAGITAGRQYFKGASNEAAAEQHWKALLPLAAEAEFERNK